VTEHQTYGRHAEGWREDPALPGLPGSDDSRPATVPGMSAWADAMADMRATGDYLPPADVADLHALSFPDTPAGDAAFAAYIAHVSEREIATREVHEVRPPMTGTGHLPAHQAATYWGNPDVQDQSELWPDYGRPELAGSALVYVPGAFDASGRLIPGTGEWIPAVPERRFPDYLGNGRCSDRAPGLPAEPYHYAMHHGLDAGSERVVSNGAATGWQSPGLPCDAPAVPLPGFPAVDSAPAPGPRHARDRRPRRHARPGWLARVLPPVVLWRGRYFSHPENFRERASRVLCRLGWLTSARAGAVPQCGDKS
jgi:hypothetical protein